MNIRLKKKTYFYMTEMSFSPFKDILENDSMSRTLETTGENVGHNLTREQQRLNRMFTTLRTPTCL